MSEIIKIYTDGACKGNPGPGGYGAVLILGTRRKELSGGFRKTTNNRMELLACIEALRSLKRPCNVVLTSEPLRCGPRHCGQVSLVNSSAFAGAAT